MTSKKNSKPNIVRSNEIYELAKKIIPAGTQTDRKSVV